MPHLQKQRRYVRLSQVANRVFVSNQVVTFDIFCMKDEDSKMYRGCMSDVGTIAQILCLTDEQNCYKCNFTECNYLQSFQLDKPIDLNPAGRSDKNPSDIDFYRRESSSGHSSSFRILKAVMGLLFT